MSNNNNLFSDFPAFSKVEWQNKVLKDLKGKPLEDLKWHLGEKLKIDPFYHPDDNIQTTILKSPKAANNDWKIGEDFKINDFVNANKIILSALENGTDAPRFIFKAVPSVEDFGVLFKNIIPSYIHTYFKIEGANPDYLSFLKNYHSYLLSQSINTEPLQGSIQQGEIANVEATQLCKELFPAFKNINLNFTHQDIEASKIVDALLEILIGLDQILQQVEKNQVKDIELSIGVGKSYFIEIAKIRSIKILWANLIKAYDVEQTSLSIDAHINPNAFSEDANTNMIRSMSIAMSAIIGGVNRLTVLPSDQKVNSFSSRIARNIQHLLKMESYLDRVIDPAAGSFYIEKLTQLFCDQAWEKFILK